MQKNNVVQKCAVAAGLIFIALTYGHVNGVNGPSYFRWVWVRGSDNGIMFLSLLFAAAPLFAAQLLISRYRRVALALLVLTPALLQATAIRMWPAAPRGIARAEAILRHPYATSYFTVADRIESSDEWLLHFDKLLPSFEMHAATKPPGPVSFFVVLISIFGREQAPFVAAILMLSFGCAAVAATYAAFKLIAGEDVAFHAATVVALLPSMTAFYPAMDWLYPVFSVAAIAAWHLALARSSRMAAAVFGFIVFAMSWWTYSLLVLGAACVLMTMASLVRKAQASLVLCAIATIIACNLVLWAVTGFDPIRSFQAAVTRQDDIIRTMNSMWDLQGLGRHYPRTIPGDLQEVAFGMSWVPVVIAGGWAWHRARRTERAIRSTALAAIATPFIAAATGLLAAETSRVWIFMMPLVALPVALELSTWTLGQRLTTYAVLLGCTIAVCSNIAAVII